MFFSLLELWAKGSFFHESEKPHFLTNRKKVEKITLLKGNEILVPNGSSWAAAFEFASLPSSPSPWLKKSSLFYFHLSPLLLSGLREFAFK